MANIENSFEFVISFFRVSPDNEVLKNEEFELRSVDNKSINLKLRRYDNGRQGFSLYVDEQENYEYHKLMPDFMLNAIQGLQTRQDAIDYFNSSDFYDVDTFSSYIRARFTLPVVVHQLKPEPGFYSRDFLFGMEAKLFAYTDSSGNITRIIFEHTTYSAPSLYLYDKTERQFRNLNDLKLNFIDYDMACLNTTDSGLIITDNDQCDDWEFGVSTEYSLVPYFVADKGNITFSIENTVNGQMKYNASEDKDLEYKINIKNNGDVTSSENVITTYVPDEVIVNENTISDSGTYNSNDHSITWVINLIEPGETKEFNFKATAPESKDGKELIGHSIIKSKQVKTEVVSNNTIVSLDKIVEISEIPATPVNPETSIPVYASSSVIVSEIYFFISFIMIIFLTVLLEGRKKKKKDTD